MVMTETERRAVNWRRFSLRFGITELEGDGAIKFSRTELRVLRRLLQMEIAGEVIGNSSDAFKAFTQAITDMEQFMADRGL